MQKQPGGVTLLKTIVVVVLVMTTVLSYESMAIDLTIISDVQCEGVMGSFVSGVVEDDSGMAGTSLNVLSRNSNSSISRKMSLGPNGVEHAIFYTQDGGDSLYNEETGSYTVGKPNTDDNKLCPLGEKAKESKSAKTESSLITGGTDAFLSSGRISSSSSAGTAGTRFQMTAHGIGVMFSKFRVSGAAGNVTKANASTGSNDVAYANGKLKMNRSMDVRR